VLVLVLVEVYQKIAKPRPITVDILDSAGNILGQLVSGPLLFNYTKIQLRILGSLLAGDYKS
jgi:hypothetical protein